MNPNPHGALGLVARSAGSNGAVSDIVVSNNFGGHSLDLLFPHEKSGVGFNTIASGGASVQIRIYSTTNVFLGMLTTPANPAGTNFIGVWSSIPIGRINLFNPSGGPEGADNIQAWAADPPDDLYWFYSEAAFEAVVASEGNISKGLEDFEESILKTGADTFDDPLESGVPNLPDGFPFPEGLTGLPNLRVQSNIDNGNPVDENPRGEMGLLALAGGFVETETDVLLAAFFNDGLDLIFTNRKSGVGFNTITVQGGTFVEVRVYSTDNEPLGMLPSPANTTGTNFIGVLSPDPIGRVNVYDPNHGFEGVDNIQTWADGLAWFTDQAEFEAFSAAEGSLLKGIEDFEEAILNPGFGDFFDDPLEPGVPNLPDGFPFPDGMTGLPNLIVQSNLGGGNPGNPNPHGTNGLLAQSISGVSDVVVYGFQKDSLDLIFTHEKLGVGFDAIIFGGGPSPLAEVRIYSSANVFLGMMTTPGNDRGTNFIGVYSSIPIGRINIFNPTNGRAGGDNIQVWGDAMPCPWDLDNSGDVGVKDLLILLGAWGSCPPKGDCSADFDDSGDVGVKDLLFLLGAWGLCP